MTAHFIFTDFRTDVPKLLAAMDVVVLATHYESFELAPLEATANGWPVVAGNVGGITSSSSMRRPAPSAGT